MTIVEWRCYKKCTVPVGVKARVLLQLGKAGRVIAGRMAEQGKPKGEL